VQLIPEHWEADVAALQDNTEQACEGSSNIRERSCEDRKREGKWLRVDTEPHDAMIRQEIVQHEILAWLYQHIEQL
jgi:hypothetical protein